MNTEGIIAETCKEFGITKKQLCSKQKSQRIRNARKHAIIAMRAAGSVYTEIATTLHVCNRTVQYTCGIERRQKIHGGWVSAGDRDERFTELDRLIAAGA